MIGSNGIGVARRASLVGGVLMALLSLSLGGCFWRGSSNIDGGAYAGPPMALESAEEDRVLAVEVPTPGWALVVDDVRERPDAFEVLATLRRPDPAYLYAQMLVTLRSVAGVRTDQAIRVYTRVLDHDGKHGPYRLSVEGE